MVNNLGKLATRRCSLIICNTILLLLYVRYSHARHPKPISANAIDTMVVVLICSVSKGVAVCNHLIHGRFMMSMNTLRVLCTVAHTVFHGMCYLQGQWTVCAVYGMKTAMMIPISPNNIMNTLGLT